MSDVQLSRIEQAIGELRADINTMRTDMNTMRTDMNAGFARLDQKIDDTETRLRILIENTRDDVRMLAEHYTPLERRVTALERRLPPR